MLYVMTTLRVTELDTSSDPSSLVKGVGGVGRAADWGGSSIRGLWDASPRYPSAPRCAQPITSVEGTDDVSISERPQRSEDAPKSTRTGGSAPAGEVAAATCHPVELRTPQQSYLGAGFSVPRRFEWVAAG